jgi:haloalkane dehalogenase
MKLLQTPLKCFDKITDFPYSPNYQLLGKISIHYVDEGTNNDDTLLLMHGEPTWSYLYRHMISPLIEKGFRVVAPDLVGFGRSDKPASVEHHTYSNHVQWMTTWMKKVNLTNITLFCQDWGSLIGLRLAIENQERFKRIILSNGGLPTGSGKPTDAFLMWQNYARSSPDFDIGDVIQFGTVNDLSTDILENYKAPFPDETYKIAPRIMPSLVPTSPNDPEYKANKLAHQKFKQWTKPFLTAFSDSDPITKGTEKYWQKKIPGAQGRNHPIIKDAGHFVQEDKGLELVNVIIKFIEDT